MLVSLLRWMAFAASLSLPLVYSEGGTCFVKDTKRSVATTGGHCYLRIGPVFQAAIAPGSRHAPTASTMVNTLPSPGMEAAEIVPP